LQCLIRERLLVKLRELENGRYLPRERVMLVESDVGEHIQDHVDAAWPDSHGSH
jgi:hypothetical protein